jgi:hypothetical protein
MVTHWTLPGTFVNTNSDPNCDLFYEENAAFLKPPQGTSATHCWYVEDGLPLTASVHVFFRCTQNGKLFDETIIGQFNVHRPTVTFHPTYLGTPVVVANGALTLNPAMSFSHDVRSDFTGAAGYTQLIDGEYTDSATGNLLEIGGGTPHTELDKAEFYYGTPAITATNGLPYFHDAPLVGYSPTSFMTSEANEAMHTPMPTLKLQTNITV